MALIYVLLEIAVYLSISIGYALLAVVLNQILLPLPPPELSIDIPGIVSSGERIISAVQLNPLISILLVMYCVGAGALVLFYLYRVTARAIPPTAPLEDGDELKRFLPLLAVAAISTTAVIVFNIVAMQVRTAQLQNHIYCEVLQLGMTHKEVSIALNEVSPQTHVWFEDTPYPALSEKATYYRVIYWDNYYLDRNYDLSLWLGYDASDRLVWRGRFWSAKNLPEEGVDTIECPWTFYQSVTAR
jgi:hypothetical protein